MTSRQCFIVTFYLGCMVSEITRFYCKPDMTLSSVLRQGALHALFHDGFWKSDHDFLIAFHSNFLSWIHGFRDNEVLWPTGYEFIVISLLGAFHTSVVDGIWKSDPGFIIMVYWHISRRLSYRFEVIRHFVSAGNCSIRPILGFCLGYNTSKFHNYTFLIPKRVFLTSDRIFWASVRKNRFTSVALLNNKKSHRTRICCPHLATRPLIGPEPTVVGLVTSQT